MENYITHHILFGNKDIIFITKEKLFVKDLLYILCSQLDLQTSDYKLYNGNELLNDNEYMDASLTKLNLQHNNLMGGFINTDPVTSEIYYSASSPNSNNTENNNIKKNIQNLFVRDQNFRIDYSKYSDI